MPMGFGGFGAFAGLTILITVIFSLAIPIAICWLLVVVMRNVAGGPGPRWTPRDPAADALRYRFASGQITQAQFEEAMRALGYEKRS
jgi:uncharacterized membrane protein